MHAVGNENDEFDEILRLEQMNSKERYQQSAIFANPASFARMTKLTIFRQRRSKKREESQVVKKRAKYWPDSSISPLCRYRSLKRICSNLGLWRNIVKFAKFPLILLSKLLWRNFVKFAIFVIVCVSWT